MKRLKTLLNIASLWLLLGGLSHAGTVHYYYTDPQGTPLVKTDASGNVIARYDYAPYGATVASLGAAPNGPGYTGHVNDPESGLVYMQARYYDPALGRFLSIDPVAPSAGNGFSFNRYAYAANNPIEHTDPDGRQYDEPGIELENRMNDPAVAAGELQASQQAIPIAVGMVPVAGDAQNIYEAAKDPSVLNITVAAIGAIPEVGGIAAKVLKEASAVAKGTRRVGDFTRAERNAAKAESATANGGKMACADCGKPLENIKNEKGVSTPSNQAQVHHDPAIKDGGGRHSEAVVLCPTCHIQRHKNDGP